jgi:hypothetical protein
MIKWVQHVPRNQETARLKHTVQAYRLNVSGVFGTAYVEKRSETLALRG